MAEVAVHGGEGIGPEVTDAALRVLDAAADVETWTFEAGPDLHEREGVVVRDEDLDRIAESRAVLFGASAMPPGEPSVILTLRRALGLYLNVRPIRALFGDVDLVVHRELSEGLYVREHETDGGRHVDRRVTTEAGIDRFLEAVADHVDRAGRERVTLLHKANVVHGDTVWLERFRQVFPDGEAAIVDSGLYRLVVAPGAFDAVVCPNLYGDIASDVLACHVGSLGQLPSASFGEGPPLFEPVHGTAPDIAGQGIANPTGMLLSVALLLEELDRPDRADALRRAVADAARERPTPDLGGDATTEAFTDRVLDVLEVRA